MKASREEGKKKKRKKVKHELGLFKHREFPQSRIAATCTVRPFITIQQHPHIRLSNDDIRSITKRHSHDFYHGSHMLLKAVSTLLAIEVSLR